MNDHLTRFGPALAKARASARLSQEALASLARLSRLTVVRIENSLQTPKWDEAVRLATALKAPLQYFLDQRGRPAADLSGIAFELYHLGISDLEISGARAPGSFRSREEVLAISLQGDRPQPSLIEAVPFVLASWNWRVSLLIALANEGDLRVWSRIGWLADITLNLGQRSDFPVKIVARGDLESIVRSSSRPEGPDSLGHPDPKNKSPIWKRWNITYAADVETFLRRAQELAAAKHARDVETELNS